MVSACSFLIQLDVHGRRSLISGMKTCKPEILSSSTIYGESINSTVC